MTLCIKTNRQTATASLGCIHRLGEGICPASLCSLGSAGAEAEPEARSRLRCLQQIPAHLPVHTCPPANMFPCNHKFCIGRGGAQPRPSKQEPKILLPLSGLSIEHKPSHPPADVLNVLVLSTARGLQGRWWDTDTAVACRGLQRLLPQLSKRAPVAPVLAVGARWEQHQGWGRGREPSAAARGGTAAPPRSTPRARCLPPCWGRQDTSQHTPGTATAHLAPLHTRGGDSNWRARDRWDGRGRQAGGAWGQDGGMGRKEGRDAASAGRIPPSPCLFPLGKKKGRLFPAWIFFSQRPRPLPVKPHLKPPCRHGNGPKGTDGPGEPNPNSRGSSAGVRAGQEQALATRLRGDREVSSLTLLCLVLQPWQGVRRLGATSGRPRRREGHARSPPKGHEPSETHHPVSWTSLATGRAASSQTSPASPCPPLANLTPYDGGLHSTWLWGPDFFICEVSRHRAQLAQPCQVSQTDSSEQTGDEDWVG